MIEPGQAISFNDVVGPRTEDNGFKHAFEILKGETLGGLTAPLTFKQGKPTSLPCWFYFQVKDGKFATLGTSYTCASA